MKLPEPELKSDITIEEAISNRKSIRRYKAESLTVKQLSQIVWAAAGKRVDAVTGASRTYPSAGGIYPLNLYIVIADVEGIDNGIYRYLWQNHSIELVKKGNGLNTLLSEAALGQLAVSQAPVSLVFTAVYSKVSLRYAKRGVVRYVHMDAGHAAENVYLQVVAMGLGTVAIGAFDDEKVAEVLGINIKEKVPIYIMPVGIPR